MRFVLTRGGTIRGKVILADGSPLAKAMMDIKREGKSVATATCDDDGKFKATVPLNERLDVVFTGVQKRLSGGGITYDTSAPC